MFFNMSGLWHLSVASAALFIAMATLAIKEVQNNYSSAVFVVFSVLIVCVGMFPPLATKENGNNFKVFLPSWIFYFFAAILPSFAQSAFSGAWGSVWILVIATCLQWILGSVFIPKDERNW